MKKKTMTFSTGRCQYIGVFLSFSRCAKKKVTNCDSAELMRIS